MNVATVLSDFNLSEFLDNAHYRVLVTVVYNLLFVLLKHF